ncbi:hypothetical protein JAAARDRAFT_50232 [Jaapia argillacea MUCL 33604]|uniref:Uncharacterized protein n=1 Tax=Jaapia argillacea MUCL 33604 TaxID=933084 RepID=A0A067PCC3_9AGAM|nr:hypothetical protein JAAARDRAFT_50232 [Jaapia argillacea MUCL 33604]
MSGSQKDNLPPPASMTVIPISSKKKPTKGPKCAWWNLTCDTILIDKLKLQKADGKQTNNASCKQDAWTVLDQKQEGEQLGLRSQPRSPEWGAIGDGDGDGDDSPLDPQLIGEGGPQPSGGNSRPSLSSSESEEEVMEVPPGSKKRTRAVSNSSPSSALSGKLSGSLKEVAAALAINHAGLPDQDRKMKAVSVLEGISSDLLSAKDKICFMQLICGDTGVLQQGVVVGVCYC